VTRPGEALAKLIATVMCVILGASLSVTCGLAFDRLHDKLGVS
jgi:hypothetical protein